MNKDIDYSSLVEDISNHIGMKEYLSIVFDAVKTHRLTKDEFIHQIPILHHIVIAIESNAFDDADDLI